MQVTILPVAVFLAVAGSSLSDDAFVRDARLRGAVGIDRLVTDVQLGKGSAEARLERWLVLHPQAKLDDRLAGYLALCDTYLRQQKFGDGVRVCGAAEKLKAGSSGSVLGLQQAFRAAGPATWSSGSVRIPLVDGQVTKARRGRVSVEALVDTGAEIGVVSASVAKALGARPVGAAVSVGTTTTPISGGIVVIDVLRVGSATLRNMTAVVIADEQAAYAGLKLVIALPAIVALGRFAYLDHGRTLVLGAGVPPLGAHRARAYWDPGGLGLEVQFAKARLGAQFDSGSRRTWLFPVALGALSDAERSGRRPAERRIGGVGGERVEKGWLLPAVEFGIAGRPWRLGPIEMAERDDEGQAARIGTGLIRNYADVIFDLRAMQVSLSP